jgi:hypothetical protein
LFVESFGASVVCGAVIAEPSPAFAYEPLIVYWRSIHCALSSSTAFAPERWLRADDSL